MDLTFNDRELAFRDELRAWFEGHDPGREPEGDPSLDPASIGLTPELMAQIPAVGPRLRWSAMSVLRVCLLRGRLTRAATTRLRQLTVMPARNRVCAAQLIS